MLDSIVDFGRGNAAEHRKVKRIKSESSGTLAAGVVVVVRFSSHLLGRPENFRCLLSFIIERSVLVREWFHRE